MTAEISLPPFALVKALEIGGDGPRVAVKDCIDIAGFVTGCGSRAFADAAPATAHAAVVETLLAENCRIVGKTNMHELAFGMTGVNAFHGTPVNPNWPDRIPGGSSSGSAVAVAAGAVDFAVGTDTGGSIRQPAICCGVFGFKPTFGRIDRRGASPANSSLDCIGPFAQGAEGIERAMDLMDPTFTPVKLTETPRLARVEVEADEAVLAAVAAALKGYGSGLPALRLPLLEEAFAAGMTIINAETASAFGHLIKEGAPLGEDVRGRIARAAETTPDAVAAAEDIRRRFTAAVDEALETVDALVLPALPVVPPTLQEARDPLAVLPLTRLLRPFNLSGHPALVLPLTTEGGLPAGLQIVGRKGDDARVCAIATWFGRNAPALTSKEVFA